MGTYMKELDRGKLSEFIIKLRNSRGLSRDEMGNLLGVSGKTVTRWEKGETLPTMPDIISICNEFNCSLDEFFEGQINVDKEINRKLSDVGDNIEKLNDNIIDLVGHVETIYSEKQAEKGKDDLTWLWLLLTHTAATVVAFLSHSMSRIGQVEALAVSLVYIVIVSCFIVKKRNDKKNMRMFLLYAVILIVNLLSNYVIYANDNLGVIINPEVLAVNGAIYGIKFLDPYNMDLLLAKSMLIYVLWIVFCAYHIISKPSNRRIILAITAVFFLLPGFIDVTPFYSVEELDAKYGTSISNLGYHYKKVHHFSLLDHKKTEYVFRGTEQYSRYTFVIVRVADQMSYLTNSSSSKVRKTLPLTVKGYDAEIRVFEGWGDKSTPYADVTVKVNNGYLRVEIMMDNSMDQDRDWKEEPLDDDSYIKIFGDLLSILLKERGN